MNALETSTSENDNDNSALNEESEAEDGDEQEAEDEGSAVEGDEEGSEQSESEESNNNRGSEDSEFGSPPIGLNRKEDEDGLYPDIDDEGFLQKLLAKREFRESKQAKITDEMLNSDICKVSEFEYTPVQRFIAQFMSPDTPYNSMLLYHGVGVGKTCTAILTAEAFLELTPKNKVYILAPPAIQAGFYRTIFDITRLKLGTDENSPNQHDGCTGNRYLELTQMYYERDKKEIEFRVNKLINKRYAIMGYVAFRNMIRDILSQIPASLPEKRQRELEVTLLKKAFSGSLIIVDEAHNMRDISEADADDQNDGAADERSDASAGKKLAPQLRRLLSICDGNKLLLMTATPMYNNYLEIISLLNFLLIADHADESDLLRSDNIQFHIIKDDEGKDIEVLTPESESRLIEIANGHVSFMRGENPRAFPARLNPAGHPQFNSWPRFTPDGKTEIPMQQQKDDVQRLPLVICPLNADSLLVIQNLTERLVAAKGVGIRTIDTLLQAGNCTYPGDGTEGRTGNEGFQSWFTGEAIPGTFEGTRLSTIPQYRLTAPESNPMWMTVGKTLLGRFSPKFNKILASIQSSRGISFVYSRFVESGAVIFSLLLEANGYSPWGRSAPLFKTGVVVKSQGRQCAKCSRREAGHPLPDPSIEESRDNHKFSPAYYALLTASNISTVDKEGLPLSPNNTKVIAAARDPKNIYGQNIKVIVGSQVAGEGLDLKGIRELHILEGWFHLSKEEQIVGRGIRYCSHNGLLPKERNCTVNLYVNVFPPELNKETIDQYTYRTAMNKAVRIGNVSRALKQGAADCNLNRDAILVTGLTDQKMEDSQGNPLTVDLNDKPYTPICDWIKCTYKCKPTVDFATLKEDISTYDLYAARFAEQHMITRLKAYFKQQTWTTWADIQKIFADIPKQTLLSLLMRVVNNPSVIFNNNGIEGHLIFRNNLFLFQPSSIQDVAIPLALRYGIYSVKRDSYEPQGFTAAPERVLLSGAKKTAVGMTMKKATLAAADAGGGGGGGGGTVDGRGGATVDGTAGGLVEGTGRGAEAGANDLEEGAQEGELLKPELAISLEVVLKFWLEVNKWIEAWASDAATVESIVESIPDTEAMPLGRSITAFVDRDYDKKENIETRLKRFQWWGKAVVGQAGAMASLRKAIRQYIWDSFLKGREQVALLTIQIELVKGEAARPVPYIDDVNDEQSITYGSINAVRYMDLSRKVPIYVCGDTECAPSIVKTITSSATDTVVKAKANQRTAAEIYGFMVPWKNTMMFKTNEPKPEGKPPGGGAACAIVSTVKGHRMKLVVLGEILNRYTGTRLDLTEEVLAGRRKLTGAPSFCALLEIVLRWMDIRREMYGGLRYFYRPLSSYYSEHKAKD